MTWVKSNRKSKQRKNASSSIAAIKLLCYESTNNRLWKRAVLHCALFEDHHKLCNLNSRKWFIASCSLIKSSGIENWPVLWIELNDEHVFDWNWCLKKDLKKIIEMEFDIKIAINCEKNTRRIFRHSVWVQQRQRKCFCFSNRGKCLKIPMKWLCR